MKELYVEKTLLDKNKRINFYELYSLDDLNLSNEANLLLEENNVYTVSDFIAINCNSLLRKNKDKRIFVFEIEDMRKLVEESLNSNKLEKEQLTCYSDIILNRTLTSYVFCARARSYFKENDLYTVKDLLSTDLEKSFPYRLSRSKTRFEIDTTIIEIIIEMRLFNKVQVEGHSFDGPLSEYALSSLENFNTIYLVALEKRNDEIFYDETTFGHIIKNSINQFIENASYMDNEAIKWRFLKGDPITYNNLAKRTNTSRQLANMCEKQGVERIRTYMLKYKEYMDNFIERSLTQGRPLSINNSQLSEFFPHENHLISFLIRIFEEENGLFEKLNRVKRTYPENFKSKEVGQKKIIENILKNYINTHTYDSLVRILEKEEKLTTLEAKAFIENAIFYERIKISDGGHYILLAESIQTAFISVCISHTEGIRFKDALRIIREIHPCGVGIRYKTTKQLRLDLDYLYVSGHGIYKHVKYLKISKLKRKKIVDEVLRIKGIIEETDLRVFRQHSLYLQEFGYYEIAYICLVSDRLNTHKKSYNVEIN